MNSTKLQTVNRFNANTYANLVAKLITQLEEKTSARGSRYCSFKIRKPFTQTFADNIL